MKGSVKVKFDLGWAMSAILAVMLVVGGAARLSFTYSVQDKAKEVCRIRAITAAENSVTGLFKYEDYYDACTSIELKPALQIAMDLNKWTYEEVYPKHNLSLLGKVKKY